jgi:hypothetical protein
MPPEKRETVSVQEMVYSNMLMFNALVELLDERGLIAKPDVLKRIKNLQREMQTKREAR